jgi:hypothetical protein
MIPYKIGYWVLVPCFHTHTHIHFLAGTAPSPFFKERAGGEVFPGEGRG